MNIAILGASGWIGSTIAAEAAERGHNVIGLARDSSKLADTIATKHDFDIQKDDISNVIDDADVLIVAIGGRAKGNHEIVPASAKKLLAASTSLNRLVWVGGAGSLEVAPGVQLISIPEFPAEFKDEGLAQGEALEVFKNSDSTVNWTFVSPAAEIFPGEKTGQYRVGGDQLLSDAEGNCKISVQDYAVGLLDEVESGAHPQQRICLAY
ncbi:NAD-dependent epimerase/dehydratase family protein [Amphritea opalescens]|uniref:NAD-dependent epimerase/dehydratase family protein n=1 Tax=Amphritea opalescens TaxID=2490544 RepID=A0A430KM56_9GAMM|nr:NAD(P)H-binding protein [Amphritea opalescens]RTE64561.1 NAD-dependent epimerase/dehydratase family protein [Amphritea opalescens]